MVNGRPLPSHVAHQPEMLVDKALMEIRQLSASVRPPEFDAISLEEALLQLIDSIQRVKTYNFSLDMSDLNEELLNEQHKLLIYRVIQEGLSNIIKYAEPSRVTITLSNKGNEVSLRITDDGKGFNAAGRSGGIGLRNIKRRLQVFNGSMRVETAPEKGCTLSAQFYL
jgi:signal transduction histidine kinase